jgi:hypothetical protein
MVEVPKEVLNVQDAPVTPLMPRTGDKSPYTSYVHARLKPGHWRNQGATGESTVAGANFPSCSYAV